MRRAWREAQKKASNLSVWNPVCFEMQAAGAYQALWSHCGMFGCVFQLADTIHIESFIHFNPCIVLIDMVYEFHMIWLPSLFFAFDALLCNWCLPAVAVQLPRVVPWLKLQLRAVRQRDCLVCSGCWGCIQFEPLQETIYPKDEIQNFAQGAKMGKRAKHADTKLGKKGQHFPLQQRRQNMIKKGVHQQRGNLGFFCFFFSFFLVFFCFL